MTSQVTSEGGDEEYDFGFGDPVPVTPPYGRNWKAEHGYPSDFGIAHPDSATLFNWSIDPIVQPQSQSQLIQAAVVINALMTMHGMDSLFITGAQINDILMGRGDLIILIEVDGGLRVERKTPAPFMQPISAPRNFDPAHPPWRAAPKPPGSVGITPQGDGDGEDLPF